MLAYLTDLETRVRKVCSSTTSSTTTETSPIQLQLHKFHSQLEGFKEDLRRLVSLLPSPSNSSSLTSSSFTFPPFVRRPSLSLNFPTLDDLKNFGSNNTPTISLASEWEKLFSTLQLHLPNSTSNLHFPPLILTNLTGLCSNEKGDNLSIRLLEKLQARFELLQDSVSGITLRGFISNIPNSNSNSNTSTTTTDNDPIQIPNSPSFAKRLELKINSFSTNAQDAVSNVGLKVIKETVRDTEEVLYNAALELAGAAGRGKRALIEYRHLPTIWKNNGE